MSGVSGLYLVLLAGVAGHVLIARVPSILHTPMMSGSNFIHGIVLVGAMLALGTASGTVEVIIGFLAVAMASANVVGGFVITDRMLALFDHKSRHRGRAAASEHPAGEDRKPPPARARPSARTESARSGKRSGAQNGAPSTTSSTTPSAARSGNRSTDNKA